MASTRSLPWLALALACGVLGWFLGRWSAPTTESGELGSVTRAEAPTRSGPLLQGAPARGGGGPRSSTTGASTTAGGHAPGQGSPTGKGSAEGPSTGAPPEPGSPDGSAAGADPGSGAAQPTVTLPLGEIFSGWTAGNGQAEPQDTDLTEVMRLMAASPEAAAERVQALLDSGRPEDRKRAYAALANAKHPLHRRLAERALADARADDDIQGVMRALARLKGRDWSPEQMTGPPDTPIAGDLPSAWASKQADMGEVWIELDYPESVVAESVRIHETCAPGAIARVYALDGDDPAAPGARWIELWNGSAPSVEAPTWFEVSVDGRVRTRSIRLIVDTSRVGGWNEIDAVELLGGGRRQWASAARAGSSYSD